MRKSFQYRIYPTKSQERTLNETLRLCRTVYNAALEQRIFYWKQRQTNISKYSQMSELVGLKNDFFEFSNVNAQVLQNTINRLDRAYQNFFRRIKTGEAPGFPRFRGKDRYNSFTYPQLGFALNEKTVYLSKIGNIRVVQHRELEGIIKTCTIKRSPTGKWYVMFSCEVEPIFLPTNIGSVGIDVGLVSFVTFSNGEQIDNPRFFRKEEKSLARVQRTRAKHEKHSKQWKRRRKAVARVHERIRFKRHNFAHQESRKIVNQYGTICVEKLNIQGMVQNHCLAKSISDASWNQFTAALAYKAEWAGRQFVAVNPAYTSQDCSGCGNRQKMELSQRQYDCPCGLSLGRDHNAALNILSVGLHTLGLALEAPWTLVHGA